MKKEVIFAVFLLTALLGVAEINTPVNDYAEVYSETEEQIITEALLSTDAEFAVVTVENLEGRDIEGYSYEVAEGNLGNTSDNGLLLLIALEERQYRFEVGRGLEGKLNDAKVGRVGRYNLSPHLSKGEYFTGTLASIKEIKKYLGNTSYQPQSQENYQFWFNVIPFIVMMLIVGFLSRKGRRGKRSNNDMFLAAMVAGSMFRGGGNMGGGFGGFGGGSFGGGGASGGF